MHGSPTLGAKNVVGLVLQVSLISLLLIITFIFVVSKPLNFINAQLGSWKLQQLGCQLFKTSRHVLSLVHK